MGGTGDYRSTVRFGYAGYLPAYVQIGINLYSVSNTMTARAGSVFKAHNVAYALEKIGDFFRGSGSGILAGWPETSAKIIVEALEELSENVRNAGMTAEATAIPMALYTARELQKYLRPERSDILNQDAGRVYYRCLRSVIRELSQIDKDTAPRMNAK